MGQPIKTLQKKGKTNKEIAESLLDDEKRRMENRKEPKKQADIRSADCSCGGKEDCPQCQGFGFFKAQEEINSQASLP